MNPPRGRDALLRRAAFAALLRRHEPIAPEELATATGLPLATVRATVARLSEGGWLDRDEAGRVTGSEGLSLTNGPHRLSIKAGDYRTWCAYDALGIAGALATDAIIQTTCGTCADPLVLRLADGHVPPLSSVRLWLADGGDDLRSDFCSPTVLLCSAEHAAEWAARHQQRGLILGLDEAVAAASAAWAESAAATGPPS